MTEPPAPSRNPKRGMGPPPNPKRREALPGQKPKPAEEDPLAPAAMRAIMASPTYREADKDLDFLAGPDTRGLRLLLDYVKPEHFFRKHNVAHTIVVFGGTRIVEEKAAQRVVTECAAASAASPQNEELRDKLARAERVLAKSRYYDVAREFGRIVGANSKKTREGNLVVMTGGGPGIMEAANRGAHDAGAESIGLNITLPNEQYPNPYVTPELCFSFHYFAMRKFHFLQRARALVAFPGGYGTIDELFEVLALIQTRKMNPVPVILVGESYWQKVFDPEFLLAEGVIAPEDLELFWYADSAQEIWNDILRWHEMNGDPLLEPLRDTK
ncbi:MAG TPA: TIGR00730 family Rossman fold protein [Stellaceae bacterium]|nr:TIGR00730 family Rossman fold protein [Stellaceae bacterium]